MGNTYQIATAPDIIAAVQAILDFPKTPIATKTIRSSVVKGGAGSVPWSRIEAPTSRAATFTR